MTEIALSAPSPRDQEVQAVVLALVEAFAFEEAAAVLQGRLREVQQGKLTQVQNLFLEWSALPLEGRPDFLTFAHHRRRPMLGVER